MEELKQDSMHIDGVDFYLITDGNDVTLRIITESGYNVFVKNTFDFDKHEIIKLNQFITKFLSENTNG